MPGSVRASPAKLNWSRFAIRIKTIYRNPYAFSPRNFRRRRFQHFRPKRTPSFVSSPATARAYPAKTSPCRHNTSRRNWRRGFGIFAALLSAFLLFVISARVWPFSRNSVLQDLAEATGSSVTTTRYHATYFPPGCILEGVDFRHQQFRLITIQKLIVQGSYLGILRRHVPRIEAIRAHVFIPAFGSKLNLQTQHSTTVVDELVANGTYVEFESNKPRQQPFVFDVQEATFNNVRWGNPIAYHLQLHNPNPPGEISADGKFGACMAASPACSIRKDRSAERCSTSRLWARPWSLISRSNRAETE